MIIFHRAEVEWCQTWGKSQNWWPFLSSCLNIDFYYCIISFTTSDISLYEFCCIFITLFDDMHGFFYILISSANSGEKLNNYGNFWLKKKLTIILKYKYFTNGFVLSFKWKIRRLPTNWHQNHVDMTFRSIFGKFSNKKQYLFKPLFFTFCRLLLKNYMEKIFFFFTNLFRMTESLSVPNFSHLRCLDIWGLKKVMDDALIFNIIWEKWLKFSTFFKFYFLMLILCP